MRSFLLGLFLQCCVCGLSAQSWFEGEVIYRSETFRRIKGKLVKDSMASVDYINMSFKDGNWIQRPEGGMIEYMYFDRGTNKVYWKLRELDTLFFEDGRYRRATENNPSAQYRMMRHADTLLGKICNSLTIQMKGLKLTVFYNKDFAVNPAWYTGTKIGFYDLLYAQTRSIFLKSVIETGQSVSVTIATEVYHTDVGDEAFPTLTSFPQKRLDLSR